jgi:uncharacterized protein (TIGR02145 family)
MMKKKLLNLALGVLVSLLYSTPGVSQQLVESTKPSVPAELSNKDATLLWSDNWNPGSSSSGIVSTYFGQLDPPLTLAADDFHITVESGWDITSIWTRGTYSGANDGEGFGFRIYADDNGQPGDLLHEVLFEQYFDINSVIEIDLEEPLHLEQGVYWMGIYGYFPESAGSSDGRFNQRMWNPSPAVHQNAMIRDYADLFGLADDGWLELVNVNIDFTSLDFAIWGTGDAPPSSVVTFQITDEYGDTVEDAVITFGETVNEAGDYVFHDVDAGTYDYSVSRHCYAVAEGELEVQSDITHEVVMSYNFFPGDANGDGLVNVLDIIVIGNYFVDIDDLGLCHLNADVNIDSNVNILDIIEIINIFSSDNNDHETGSVTDADGNTYQTVFIGDQEWMSENLRVTTYSNGDAILTGLNGSEWETTTQGAYAVYDHTSESADGIDSSEEMVAAYGRMYNWYAVDDERGLCPEGWHIPSDADWSQLTSYLGSQGYPNTNVSSGVGNALKSCRQVNSPLGSNCNTTDHPRWNESASHYGFDAYGFSALPAGFRYRQGGDYFSLGSGMYVWSSTVYSSDQSWFRWISGGGTVVRTMDWKRSGFSVRCVRDVE